jgi:ribosomal protein S18 acetylase RimI-like enzyme
MSSSAADQGSSRSAGWRGVLPDSFPVDHAEAVAVLSHTEREIPASQVLALYRTARWWPERTPEQVAVVLRGSRAVGAWQGSQLIGFARAVTDGVLRAYVEDVIVAPSQRGSGIGQAVLDRLMSELGAIQ